MIPIPKRDGIPLLSHFEGFQVPKWDWNPLDLTVFVVQGPKSDFRGPIGCFGAILGPKRDPNRPNWLNFGIPSLSAQNPEFGPLLTRNGTRSGPIL